MRSLFLAAIAFAFASAAQASGGRALPAEITPFSVAAFLRRVQREGAGKLDARTEQDLAVQIREIQTAYFSAKPAGATPPELEAIARKWLQTVT